MKDGDIGGAYNTMGGMINGYKILVEKLEWERPHGRSRRRLEFSINMDLKETERESVD
jgi:hypothetical protein